MRIGPLARNIGNDEINYSKEKSTLYSICITNYNSFDTIRGSMESIFNLVNDHFEIVVCDSCSNDGSREILQEYSRKEKIRLIVKKSSRGRGRQIAFENSSGKYIISGIDTDDRLKPAFKVFLSIYHRDYEGKMLSSGTIHIIPSKLVKEIGGWRDLKWGEDIDFHKRAKILEKQHELEQTLAIVERGKNKKSFIAKISEKFTASLCMYRIGKSVFEQVKMSDWYFRPITFVLAVLAFSVCKCRRIPKLRYQKCN